MKNFLITLGTVLLIIGLIVGGGYLFVMHTINTHTYSPMDETATIEDAFLFEIESGMWPAAVVERLYEEDLIRHEWIANQLVRFNSWGTIQAGEYELHHGMSLYDMFALFTEGSVTYDAFTYIIIPEGFDLDLIADIFADALNMDAQDLMTLWDDEYFLTELIDEYWFLTDEILDSDIYHPLEGYFYPIRHEIPEGLADKRELTRIILNMTEQRLTGLRARVESHTMTFHEILTFAAIIEAETQDEEEKSTVAGVFKNRLEDGWELQTDVTVQYIAEERSFHVTPEMLAIESPYNTYLNPGLPPGPVNSPSRSAIEAAMDPEEHEYFFFISDMFGCIDHGKHYFTNLDDHMAFYQAYLRPSYDAGYSVCDPDVEVN